MGCFGPLNGREKMASHGVGCPTLGLFLVLFSPSEPQWPQQLGFAQLWLTLSSFTAIWPRTRHLSQNRPMNTFLEMFGMSPEESSLSLASVLKGGNRISRAIGGHACCIWSGKAV